MTDAAPARTVALLRGINVGGHRVKMAALRKAFADFGLDGVASFLASGNVAFDDPDVPPGELAPRLEAHLEEALGFPAPVFLRPLEHLEATVASDVVTSAEEEGSNVHVVFLRAPAGDDTRTRLDALETDDDRFHVEGREILWLRRGRMSDSAVFADLEGAFGREHTMRNVRTLRKIVAKLSPGA